MNPLALIPGKDWAYLGAIAVLLVGFGVYTKHERNIGAAHEKASVQAAVDKDTKKLATVTAAAEHSHDQELSDLRDYRASHPEQPVRLCLAAPAVRAPSAVARQPGAPAGNVQPVPAGDSGSGTGQAGPDIFGLLDLLAARADQVSADLRARQRIEP